MKKAIFFLVLTGIFILFSACEGEVTIRWYTSTVTGSVINAKSPYNQGISGLTVMLTYTGLDSGHDVSYWTTTDAYGTFAFYDNVEFGDYDVTVSGSSSYFFLPKEVSIGSRNQDIGNVLALPYNASLDQWTLSFILVWNDTFDDVDSYLTYPTNYYNNGGVIFDTPYAINPADLTGFFPADADVGDADEPKTYVRLRISPFSKESYSDGTPGKEGTVLTVADLYGGSDTRAVIELDVDDPDTEGPETISVRGIPFIPENGNSVTGTAENGLPTGNTYDWQGVIEFYADSYHNSEYLSNEESTEGADAILYVYFGNQIKGEYKIPRFTDIQTTALVRVNLFIANGTTDFFQIVPDIRLIPGGEFYIRSQEEGMDENGILCIKGRAR